MEKHNKPLEFIVLIAIALIVIIQSKITFEDYAFNWLKATWRTRALTSEQRSARFLIGDEGYRYIDFLKLAIPEEGAVVLPTAVGALSQQNHLQFLLLPRGIPICPCDRSAPGDETDRCSACLSKEGHYVLAVGDFPPEGTVGSSKVLIEFPYSSDTLHGFYAPANSIAAIESRLDSFNSPANGQKPIAIFTEIALILLLAITGLTLNRRILSDRHPWIILLLGIPVGLGITTFALFTVGWLGLPITPFSTVAIWTLLLTALVLLLRHNGQSLWPKFPRIEFRRHFQKRLLLGSSILMALFLIALIGASIAVSLGRSYSTYDGIANWALKGYAIAEFDTIFAGRHWGGHGLSYPQNIHLGTAMFRTLTGDVLPGSKLLHPTMYAVTILMNVFFINAHARSPHFGLAAGALVASIPFFFYHSTLGFANVIFTGYLVSAYLCLQWGSQKSDYGLQSLGGLLFGLAAWTRPEGVYFGAVLMGLLLLHHRVRSHNWRPLKQAAPWFLGIATLWQAFGSRYQAQDEIGSVIGGVLHRLRAEDLPLSALQELGSFAVDHLTDPPVWGYAWLIVLISLTITATGARNFRNRTIQGLWLGAIVMFILPLSLFFAVGMTRQNFDLFLSVSFDRALFPGMTLALTAGLQSLAHHFEGNVINPPVVK